MPASAMIVAVLIPLGFFLMIFGIVYMYKRENLAMIDKGMNPRERRAVRPVPYRNLKWGLLLIGSGVGLFLAYMLDQFVIGPATSTVEVFEGRSYINHHENPAIYFALIAIGGGLGLFGSYRMEKKWWDENKETV